MTTEIHRDPEQGEVWRVRRHDETGRTVEVLASDGLGGFVTIRSLTRFDGAPTNRAPRTLVRRSLWHQRFVFERETA